MSTGGGTHQAGGARGEELFLHVGKDGVADDGEDEEEEADEAAGVGACL